MHQYSIQPSTNSLIPWNTLKRSLSPERISEFVKSFLQKAGECLRSRYRGQLSSHIIIHPTNDHPEQTFRFKTRLQSLNSMEASARASINFLEQLHIYHRQHGNAPMSIPTISEKPLDLWKLRKEVQAAGGYAKVRIILSIHSRINTDEMNG